jgi:hypothetical protein
MLSARFLAHFIHLFLSRSYLVEWTNVGVLGAGWQAGRLAGWQAGRLAGWHVVTSSEPVFCYIPDRNLDAEVHERHNKSGWWMLVLGARTNKFFSDPVIRTDTGPQPPRQAASQPPPLSILTAATSGKRHCNTTTKSKVPGVEGSKEGRLVARGAASATDALRASGFITN